MEGTYACTRNVHQAYKYFSCSLPIMVDYISLHSLTHGEIFDNQTDKCQEIGKYNSCNSLYLRLAARAFRCVCFAINYEKGRVR